MAGITVGKVSLRVVPDLDGFRSKVESEIRRLGDVEIDVNPDMDGFRQKVKSATRGMNATVDVDADTKRLIAETEAALKALKNRNFHLGKMHMDAVFREESADRRIKQFLKKADATAVIKLVVPEMKIREVSQITDHIEKKVSRDPVKIRFAAPRHEIAKLADSIKSTLKDRMDAGKVAIGAAVLPQAEKAQDKYLKFLDEVRAKRDKLKKSDWQATDIAPLMEYKSPDYLVKELKRARELGRATKVFNKNIKNARYNPALHQELLKLEAKTKELRGITDRANYGKAFLKLANGLIQVRKGVREADFSFDPLEFQQLRDLSKEYQDATNVVKIYQRTRREIYKDKLLNSKAGVQAQKQLKTVSDAYKSASDQIQDSVQKIRERSKDLPTKAYEKIPYQLRRQVELLKKSKKMQVKEPESLTLIKRLNALKERANETIRVRTSETIKAVKATRQLQKASKNTGFGGKRRRGLKTIDEVGTERFAGLSRIGWMIGAIAAIAAPAAQAISGIVAALPALGGAALAALGVTLLGLDGIKEAATAAEPALNRAKEAVSGVFQTRLTPQFEQLGGLLDRITPQLTQVAEGMSDFSQGLVDGLTSNIGETNIQKLLGNTADLFSKMKPFAKDFTEGLLDMAGAGSETFPALADGMNRFGESFKQNISELTQSGQLQAAIQATYDTIGSLGTNLGRVLRAGIETAPDLVDSLVPLIDGLGDGLVGLMEPLSALSSFVGPTLGAAFSGIGEIAASAASGLSEFFGAITPGAVDLFTGLGDAIGSLAGPFADLLGGIGPGVGDVFSQVGQGLTDMANTINANPQLASDMRRLGSALGSLLSIGGDSDGGGFLGSGKPLVSESDVQLVADLASGLTQVVEAVKGINVGRSIWDNLTVEGPISNWLGDKLFGGQEEIEFSPRITVNPQIDMAGAITSLQASATGPIADLEATIAQFKVNAEAVASELQIDISPQIRILQEATDSTSASEAMRGVLDQITAATQMSPEQMEVQVDPSIQMGEAIDMHGQVDTALAPLKESLNNQIATLGDGIDASSAVASIGDSIGSALGGVDIPVDGLASNLSSALTGALSGLQADISGQLDGVVSAVTDAGSEASAGFSGAMTEMSGTSTGIVSEMAGTITSTLSMDLSASGAAVGLTFAAGLRSSIAEVRTAAGELAEAARVVFPNSPAKEGPFSGNGWIDKSGVAVGQAFADGMKSQVGVVNAAATQVADAAHREFDQFRLDPTGNMEALKRDQVLQPVLEANAKKIADWRKREEEREKKHVERLSDIDANKSKGDKKEEQRAKANENLAKQSAESYEKLLESLETPDYRDIDRSFKAYWLDGISETIKDRFRNIAKDTGLLETTKTVAKNSVAEIRKAFGDSPILSQIEFNINAEHFDYTVQQAIEEANLHEIPINFVISNLDQLKSDLGMSDGVVSRAMDAAMNYNPANDDVYRYDKNKPEIHYHVTDMEEAIRLEQQRERKELLKMTN